MARVDRYILLALLLLNAVLKLCWLGVNELSGDEPFTVFWSQQRTSDLLDMFKEENNPPLYFFLMKWWSAVTPYEVPWLRVPSAVFSALAVWPLFLLVRKHAALWTAVAACLLFTFCNEHYTYAHEVRAYSLLTLLTITGMWQVDRLARSGPRTVLWLALVNTALVYTHFMGWAAIGIQFLCTLLVPEWRAGHKRWSVAMLVTATLFVPYGWVFVQRVGTSVSQGTWLTAPAWDEPYSMLWRWSNAPVVTVLFLLVVALGLWKSKAKGVLERVALIWCGVPLVGLFLFSFAVPLYLDRYLVWAAPGFAVLVTVCLSHLGKEVVVRAGLVVASVSMLATFVPWKSNGARPSAVVRQVDKWRPRVEGATFIAPYWYGLTFVAASELDALKGDGASITKWFGMANTYEVEGPLQLTELPTGAQAEVVLIRAASDLTDPERRTLRLLREHYSLADSVEADRNVWVYRFRK